MPGSPQPIRLEAPAEKLARLKALRADNDRLRREALRRNWLTPGEFARAIDPTTRQTEALDVIDTELAAVQRGETMKLAIYAPPQEGKSERAVRRFVTWLLSLDPSLRIAVVSFEADTAVRWGRQIKRDIDDHPELGIRVRADSQAAGRWETDAGGGVYCVGIRGALTGRPVDVLVIDDPVKDRAAAESKIERERAWDFWENVAKIRAHRTVLIQTRWHTDDLGGRFETREAGEWRVVKIPAIAEADDDVLGRKVGEEMRSQTPDKRPPGWFTRMRESMSAYVFSALFQQTPTAGEGNMFRRADWRYWSPLADQRVTLGDVREVDLRDTWRFLTVDLAASTKTSADFTVVAAWALTLDGDLICLDRVRDRMGVASHVDMVLPLRQRWAADTAFVESRMFGTTLVIDLTRRGIPVSELDADVDKVTRAIPAANLVTQHRIWLPRTADWLDDWLDEHAEFPNSRHDDQVDVTAYAVRVALAQWNPAGHPAEPTATSYDPFDVEPVDYLALPY